MSGEPLICAWCGRPLVKRGGEYRGVRYQLGFAEHLLHTRCAQRNRKTLRAAQMVGLPFALLMFCELGDPRIIHDRADHFARSIRAAMKEPT